MKRSYSPALVAVFLLVAVAAVLLLTPSLAEDTGECVPDDSIPLVSGLALSTGENTINASWDAGEGVDGYKVLVRNAAGELISEVNTENTSVKIAGVKGQNDYAVSVAAYILGEPSRISPECEAVTATPYKVVPSLPSSLKITSSELSCKISWKASKDATGYIVSEYNTDTATRTTLLKTSKTSCTLTSLKPNVEHRIQIRAYRVANDATTYSGFTYSKIAMPTLDAPGSVSCLKCGTKDGKIYLSWSSATNATSYRVLCYSPEKNIYYTVSETTGRSYTLTKNLKLGTEYKFSIRPLRTKGGFTVSGNKCTASAITVSTKKNGWLTEDGSKYLYKNGTKLKGKQTYDSKHYYLDAKTGAMQTGWIYHDGYKIYYNKSTGMRSTNCWSQLSDKSSFVIKVNKKKNTVTVYAKDGKNGYIIPVRAFVCSGGTSTPTGTFNLSNKWRWLWMVDDSYGQWVSQITGNYLFHSVPYWGTKDADQLDVGEYNKLGTTCSHGCIRLRAGDAKWIYDNMPIGTKIVIYNNSSTPGPLGKPTVAKLPSWHTWDPTDPNMKYKCAEKGCH